MPLSSDPQKRAAQLQALRQARKSRRWICTCKWCGQSFEGRERKASRCDACRLCLDCGKPIKNAEYRRCGRCARSAANRSDAQNAQLAALHAGIRGDANPAKRAEVRKAISEAITKNHPSKTHREQWEAHIARIRPGKLSKLEELVAPLLPGFQRQYKVGYYALDFADPDRLLVVEVQGCWHHACPVCYPNGPTYPKQHASLKNDRSKHTYLSNRGWRVVYLWEHEIRADPEGTVQRYVYNH